jgi:hypothetical protein
MATDYEDTWISVAREGLTIRWYYFPFGRKRISYGDIHSITRVSMGALTGRGRIWGTGSLRYWASLDPQRPKKKVAYVIDTGHAVKPYITPADPERFESSLAAWCSVPVEHGGRGRFI